MLASMHAFFFARVTVIGVDEPLKQEEDRNKKNQRTHFLHISIVIQRASAHPTEHITNLKHQHQAIGGSELNTVRVSPDLKALKLLNVQSGTSAGSLHSRKNLPASVTNELFLLPTKITQIFALVSRH